MRFTRRTFGMAALSAAPLLMGLASSSAERVKIGVQSISFRDLLGQPGDPIENLIGAMQAVGLDTVELFEPSILPWALVKESIGTPAMQAAIYGHLSGPVSEEHTALRERLMAWRIGTPMSYFSTIRAQFRRANMRVQAFAFTLKDYCTDAEVAWGFNATRALGTDVMTAPATTLSMARRCVPFASRHTVRLGFHGHTNVLDSNEFATPASFDAALAMSPLYYVNLDIGHFSAAGYDPVAFIEQRHSRIISVHIKDRKNHDGPNVPLGEGDTPVIAVLKLIRDHGWPIPAMIEYEHKGGPSVDAVRTMVKFIDAALV